MIGLGGGLGGGLEGDKTEEGGGVEGEEGDPTRVAFLLLSDETIPNNASPAETDNSSFTDTRYVTDVVTDVVANVVEKTRTEKNKHLDDISRRRRVSRCYLVIYESFR